MSNNTVVWAAIPFKEVSFLSYFRYKGKWCQRMSHYSYLEEDTGQDKKITDPNILVAVNFKELPFFRQVTYRLSILNNKTT